MTALVGASRAKALLWSTRDVGAREALAMGLADRVAPAGVGAVDEAVKWAGESMSDGAHGVLRHATSYYESART